MLSVCKILPQNNLKQSKASVMSLDAMGQLHCDVLAPEACGSPVGTGAFLRTWFFSGVF